LKSIRSPEQRELAALLKKWRQTAKPKPLTQEELAQKMGFKDRRVIVRVEIGDVEPTAVFVRRWCRACRRSSRELWLKWEYNCRRRK